jgi:hypothetical protein
MAREDGPGTRQGTPPKGKTGTKSAGQNPLTNIPEFVSGGIEKMKDIGQDMFSDVAGDLVPVLPFGGVPCRVPGPSSLAIINCLLYTLFS